MRSYNIHSYRAMFQFYRKHFSLAMEVWIRAIVAVMSTMRWFRNWAFSKFSNESIYRQNESDLKRIIRFCFDTH